MSKQHGKKRPGRAAGRSEMTDMHALGYGTPAEVGRLFDRAPTTVYGWAEAWFKKRRTIRVKGGGVFPAVVKNVRGVWVLKAAVSALRQSPAPLARTRAA